MRALVTVWCLVLLGVNLYAPPAFAQAEEAKGSVKKSKEELQQSLKQYKKDLAAAKKALGITQAPRAAARPVGPPRDAAAAREALQVPAPIVPGRSDLDDRQTAGQALDRLDRDTRRDLNRKLDELLLERLR